MDDPCLWRQVNITFPNWSQAEPTVLAHLAPHLAAAEAEGLIGAWFFIRKQPCWRVRYLPTEAGACARMERHLDKLTADRLIDRWTPAIYEPETRAFGGAKAMTVAHHLFHCDSRCMFTYLQGNGRARPGHRREISIMLCSILLRATGQDWYEQGDVWARVAAHRELPGGHTPDITPALPAAVRRLMRVDAESLMRGHAPLAHLHQWADAYATAGQKLRSLANGELRRGLRDILAHHVIFAWNRHGLPYNTQAVLAATATTVVFGPDPAAPQAPEGQPWAVQNTG